MLLGTSSCVVMYGQKATEPKKGTERASSARAFAFSFGDDGGYLGVQTQEVTRENFGKFGLRDVRGVAVEKVMDNSPAAVAGIQSGDVIVKFNDEEITSARKLTRLVGEVDPDHQVKITVARGGDERDITVTIGKRPMPKFENGNFEFRMAPGQVAPFPEMGQMPAMPALPQTGEMPRVFTPGGEGNMFMFGGNARQIGISVYAVTKQLGERFGVTGGVMISNVRENSPASRAGLRAGDIIVDVDGKAVTNNLDLMRSIGEKKEGDVQLTIVRDGNRQTISVTPEAGKDGGFLYEFKNEDGAISPAPGQLFRMARPATPPTPMVAPAPMTLLRPGRVI